MGNRRVSVRGSLDALFGGNGGGNGADPAGAATGGGVEAAVASAPTRDGDNSPSRRGDMSPHRPGDTAPSPQVAVAEPSVAPRLDVAKSPERQVAPPPDPSAEGGRLVKRDFYLTPEQDVEIDRARTAVKQRTGRSVARSDVVRDALDRYFRAFAP